MIAVYTNIGSRFRIRIGLFDDDLVWEFLKSLIDLVIVTIQSTAVGRSLRRLLGEELYDRLLDLLRRIL